MDDVILNVKKGRVLPKEVAHIIDDQNKQLDNLKGDIDRLDSRMQRGIKRLKLCYYTIRMLAYINISNRTCYWNRNLFHIFII